MTTHSPDALGEAQRLSGGERQRAAIERLHKSRGQTIVLVTHDRALAREADRVLLLKDGKLMPVPE